MKKDIEAALRIIEEDYNKCFRVLRKVYEHLHTLGLEEFNKFSKYKWSLDRDKGDKFSYICIRYGASLSKKCLVKRRPYIEEVELYKWVEQKDLIEEAMDEAYQFIFAKISDVKGKIHELKEIAEAYEKNLDEIAIEIDEVMLTNKTLRKEAATPTEQD